MGRPALEVADIFREHGPAWRAAQRGHLSLGQLKVMSAIEQCRTASLGGHVLRCEGCGTDQLAYNSCLMGSVPLWGVRVRSPISGAAFDRALPAAAHHYEQGPWLP